MKFEVFVDDNFHYQDESARYKAGEFDNEEEAIALCKSIVDEYLPKTFKEGMTPEKLLSSYRMFGEDPFIVTSEPHEGFSAWSYAEDRCNVICGQGEMRESYGVLDSIVLKEVKMLNEEQNR